MKNFILFFFYIGLSQIFAQDYDIHFGLIPIGARGIQSKIDATNIGGFDDRFQSFRPTFLTFFILGENDERGAYANFRGIQNFSHYVIRGKNPKSYPHVQYPGQRNTENSNRIATDFNMITHDLYGYFWGDKLKWGMGYSFQWNADGVVLNDFEVNGYGYTSDVLQGQQDYVYGGYGLGSGVYRTRFRYYFGIGPGIKTSFADRRLQFALNTSLGPYSGGGMMVAELVGSFAFSERFGLQFNLTRRRKNFREFENLPSVLVKTNELNFGLWFKLKN